MKERPILYSGSMVRAILDGRKTQTRRVLVPRGCGVTGVRPDARWLTLACTGAWHLCVGDGVHLTPLGDDRGVPCPYGSPGDRLWVRETWRYHDWTEEGEPWIQYAADDATAGPLTVSDDWTDRVTAAWESLSAPENFAIDAAARDRKWRPSIFMPRWASRLTLDVTAIRVERLQAISGADAIAEGVRELPLQEGQPGAWWTADPSAGAALHARDPVAAFRKLWDSINGDRASWEGNPWVWVVEFARAEVRK